jgi:hypothetical protein
MVADLSIARGQVVAGAQAHQRISAQNDLVLGLGCLRALRYCPSGLREGRESGRTLLPFTPRLLPAMNAGRRGQREHQKCSHGTFHQNLSI